MTNTDKPIISLWDKLSEMEKKEVLKQTHSEEQKKKRQFRPIWRYLIDIVKACLMLAVMYVLIVGLMLLA